jgi:hypothetical protein
VSAPELAQLEMLAQVDDLAARMRRWAEPDSPWEPLNRSRSLVRRLLSRLETLRIRLEAPLVVATFGGTGTGKSTLVNALVGQEVTRTGRQRPTTTRPVLIVHPLIDAAALGLPLEDFELVRVDSALLRDVVIVDCPDPDTTETETPGSNLEILHRLLPWCDVLIYTSTQQKYRSSRVVEELGQAASGCRLIFVQTHADHDSDIRDDWRRQLDAHYRVPDVFFVDSVRALRDQQAGQRPGGDFARLQDLLSTQLAASQRVQVRRANLVDLIHAALEQCRHDLAGNWPAVEQLEAALDEQRHHLTESMAGQLKSELLLSQNLWERRLLSSVTQHWGFSPFSSVLRFYNGIGAFIASMTLYRARTSAQMALIGAMQGARWIASKQQEQESEDRLARMASFHIDDDAMREAQFVISGYARGAKLDPALADQSSLDAMRDQAARVEGQFLGGASRRIDTLIEELAAKNARWFTQIRYELLFLAFIAFVLYRVGKNFFYDTVLDESVRHLTTDFYISAGVFFVLWSGLLVMLFTRRLRRGLSRRVEELATELAGGRMAHGLFPQLEQACRDIDVERSRLEAIADSTVELRAKIARSPGLGAAIAPRATAS